MKNGSHGTQAYPRDKMIPREDIKGMRCKHSSIPAKTQKRIHNRKSRHRKVELDEAEGACEPSGQDLYGPAMNVTSQDEADKMLDGLVKAHVRLWGGTERKAQETERSNLGYWAGYHDHETRLRVEELFNCVHPLLGPAKNGPPTPEEAFKMGQDFAAGKGKTWKQPPIKKAAPLRKILWK